jgi:hypothetical protein
MHQFAFGARAVYLIEATINDEGNVPLFKRGTNIGGGHAVMQRMVDHRKRVVFGVRQRLLKRASEQDLGASFAKSCWNIHSDECFVFHDKDQASSEVTLT